MSTGHHFPPSERIKCVLFYIMAIPTFQKVVMIVSLVLLVICLIIIGVSLYRHRFKEKFPPVIGSCPDYWDDVTEPSKHGEKQGVSCMNTGLNPPPGLAKNSGSIRCPGKGGIQAFTSGVWRGKSGLCHKAAWARECGVVWDGVTNSNVDCGKHKNNSWVNWF
jgi:hypothetical protein